MEFFSDEQVMLRETVQRIAKEKISPLVDEAYQRGRASPDILKILADHGLLVISLPSEYGGIGANATTRALVVEEVAKVCASTSMYIFSSQFVIVFLLEYGTESQRNKFFTFLSAGDKISSFCLTEPDYGSDAGSIQTRAVLHGDCYRVNGAKSFVSSGTVASLYVVFARTGPGERTKGISAFIVERGTPGFTQGAPERKFGFRSSELCQLYFEDAKVPKGNLLGTPGDGWRQLRECGAGGRAWGAAAQALGIAEGALDYALNYAKQRIQFGKPIIRHEVVEFMLADMAIRIEAARSLLYRTTRLIDHGHRDIASLTSASKCFASDVAMKVSEDAVQILGGYGLIEDYPVHRMMRDAKATQIFDGTNQIQRRIVARGLETSSHQRGK
jgi:alkylation response protein AidB-like acyl-CoA dehydrogenase